MISFFLFGHIDATISQQTEPKQIPFLNIEPIIDADLSEWKGQAFSEGVWDLERVKKSRWYESKRNKLIVHADEDTSVVDLSASYYMAWDRRYIYFGAEVRDNHNDVIDSKHESKRWYYKDAIAWFIEAPKDTLAETFGEGDHAFCFVIDTLMPDYGAWWRHGTAEQSYIEQPLSASATTYAIRMNPWDDSKADYILEARVDMKATFGMADEWTVPRSGDSYRMMIVHCDPDGGEHGGHLLIYGKGDNDSSWAEMRLFHEINE